MICKAVITAGGSSQRFGKTNKLLERIHLKTIIEHTVNAFLSLKEIDEIIISANSSIMETLTKLFEGINKVKIIEGGATRQQSVFNALLAIKDCDYVLIHDGARPMITSEMITDVIKQVKVKKALTVASKTIDTIKKVDKNFKIIKTIERSSLYNTQTPQAFEYKLIKEAHERLKGQDFTDDAGMLEFLGGDVYIFEGDYRNIKITTKSDIDVANVYLS